MTEEIPPIIDPHPKPKSKGKKPAPPKLKTPEEIEALDVFQSMLEADAGSEASSDPEETFDKFIHYLSRSQLNRVERRIGRIKKKVLDSPEELERYEFLCNKMSSAINRRLETSASQEALLRSAIYEKLERLSIVDFERSRTGTLKGVKLDGQWLSLPSLIRKHLGTELNQARSLLAEGLLVAVHKRHGGLAFVKRCINDFLS